MLVRWMDGWMDVLSAPSGPHPAQGALAAAMPISDTDLPLGDGGSGGDPFGELSGRRGAAFTACGAPGQAVVDSIDGETGVGAAAGRGRHPELVHGDLVLSLSDRGLDHLQLVGQLLFLGRGLLLPPLRAASKKRRQSRKKPLTVVSCVQGLFICYFETVTLYDETLNLSKCYFRLRLNYNTAIIDPSKRYLSMTSDKWLPD